MKFFFSSHERQRVQKQKHLIHSLNLIIMMFFFYQNAIVDSVLDLIGGSRSTTPVSLNSRKSPTAEMGVQVNQKDGGNRRNNNRGPQDGRRMDSQGSHENRVS